MAALRSSSCSSLFRVGMSEAPYGDCTWEPCWDGSGGWEGSGDVAPRAAVRQRRRRIRMSFLERKGADERLLGYLDPPDRLHPLLAFLLLLQELAFAGDVPAVALGQDVLPLGLDRLAGDDAPTDRRLDWHVEQLAGDQLAELGGHLAPVFVSLRAMHDGRERIDVLAREKHVDLDEVVGLEPGRLVVKARVALV